MTFTATTALPYPHLERAAAGLRGELRHRLLDAGILEAPDWSHFSVEGPQEFRDGHGRVWFGYWGALRLADSAIEDESLLTSSRWSR